MHQDARPPSTLSEKTLVPFLALAFGFTWGIAALLILFPEPLAAVFGEVRLSNPLYILAVYSPGFAAIFLVWRHAGATGLLGFLRRLTLWRAPRGWWAFLILGIPAVFYAGAALKGSLGDPFPFSPWTQVFPALALHLFLGPIEELGWRGYALPLLQRRLNPLGAGLLLGLVWAVWHIPAFLLGGTVQSAWSFGPFFAGVIAISVIMTPMFNAARGSLLLPFLYHFQMNNPIWPDAQPWDTAGFVGIAVAVVWLNRHTMLQRGAGVTRVLPSEGRDEA